MGGGCERERCSLLTASVLQSRLGFECACERNEKKKKKKIPRTSASVDTYNHCRRLDRVNGFLYSIETFFNEIT